MRIPNAERATVAIEKLVDYCLDPTNEVGQHKAKVFASALGITQINFDVLRTALLEAVKGNDAELTRSSVQGDVYVVDFLLVNGSRQATIRSVWMIDSGATDPRLISCYVKN